MTEQMRTFSSAPHPALTHARDDRSVRLVDPALPAAQYLVGAQAVDVLRLPIEATGGVIESVRPVQVQYRPGSDVVVRYSARVAWHGEPAKRETLVAASAVHGTHQGSVLITADTGFGPVEVGVWRWPFDPVLVGLADVVSPTSAAELLDIEPAGLTVEIVAYRPTDRAVVRVARGGAAIAYIKVVPPHRAWDITHRHDALLAAGVPAARVIAGDHDRGLIGLEALVGPTLRELIKDDEPGWPDPVEFARLSDAMAPARVTGAGPASRLTDGPLHANMLAAVMPESAPLLDELAARFESYPAPSVDGTVHGDLHEGQIIVRDRRIVGVLDVDDIGPGASIDDCANLIARLRFRAATSADRAAKLDDYASALQVAGRERHDAQRLDVHIAAALVGLATGPFRIQADGWRDTVALLLEHAAELSMRELSA